MPTIVSSKKNGMNNNLPVIQPLCITSNSYLCGCFLRLSAWSLDVCHTCNFPQNDNNNDNLLKSTPILFYEVKPKMEILLAQLIVSQQELGNSKDNGLRSIQMIHVCECIRGYALYAG